MKHHKIRFSKHQKLILALTTLTAIIGPSGFSFAAPAKSAWQTSLDAASLSFEKKDYSSAERLVQTALIQAGKIPALDPKRIQIYSLLLQVHYAKNDLNKAAEVFGKMIPVIKQTYGAHDKDYADSLRNYSTLLNQLGRTTESRNLNAEIESIENPELVEGYIDTKGRMAIKWKLKFLKFVNCFMLPGPFSGGLAAVYQGDPEGKILYINREGQAAIASKWHRGLPFQDGHAQVYDRSSVALIDKTGSITVPPRHDYFPTQRSEGLWPSSAGAVYYDDKGAVALSMPSHELRSFHEGLAGIGGKNKNSDVNKSWGFIDKSGKLVIPLQFIGVKDFSEGLAPVQQFFTGADKRFHREWGFIDRSGKIVVEPQYQWADQFSEGMACIGQAEPTDWTMRYGYIDKTGRSVIPPKYDWAEPFSQGLALVHLPGQKDGYDHVFVNGKGGVINRSGSWVFIDKTGKIIVVPPPAVQEIHSFSEGFSRVKIGGLYGFMDKQGNMAIKPQYRWADDFSEGLAGVLAW